MNSSGVWSLIGVSVGAILGFGLNWLRERINETKQKKNYLNDLLADLKYNKELAKERRGYGYHTLGYADAKSAKYLFEIPSDLRKQLYDAFVLTFYLNQTFNYMQTGVTLAKDLEEILEKIIPELEKFLKEKKLLVQKE